MLSRTIVPSTIASVGGDLTLVMPSAERTAHLDVFEVMVPFGLV